MPSADRRAADPTGLPRPLPVQRELFDIPDDVAYFNCASLAPQLRASAEAAALALTRRARPWTIASDDWFTGAEERRSLFARLAGLDPEGLALIPATSYGLAVAAANLTARPGQRLLVLAEDYPSNRYTWQRFAGRTGASLVAVERQEGETWGEAVLEALDERTAVVAVLATHWTDGGSVDLAAIAGRAREAGAALVVDASQALGAVPLDLAAIRPDYLVTVGYKWLLGPFALGYLYVAERRRDGVPLEENWISRLGSEDFGALPDYQDRYQPGARRFDVGQRTHFETTPMAVAALRQLLDWEVPRIAATLGQVTGRIQRAVEAIGLSLTTSDRVPHMLGIALPAPARAAVAGALAEAGVFAGVRGSSLRVSPHLWTLDQAVKITEFDGLDLIPADFTYRNLDLVLGETRRPTQRIARLLGTMVDDYDLVILDCPPGISLVGENVVHAAGTLLVPLIPTTLSVRALEQLGEFVGELDRPPALFPFFTMVDGRKRLHREVIDDLRAHRDDLAATVIPALSLVEQMAVHRAPLPVFAPRSRVTRSYEDLWGEVRARSGDGSRVRR
jgi:selenocysteine lyase/cysteine desulfurase/cellulose biosynthesis protein BcsQ